MDGNQTINFNAAKCLKEMSHWGYDNVHNVCTGTVIEVPWGIGSYLLHIIGIAIALGIIAVVAAFALALIAIAFFWATDHYR